MTPLETAQGVARIVGRCHARIIGIGADQYSDGEKQRWESKSPGQLLAETQEEIEDAVAYLCMLHMRITTIAARFQE